ncbi:MAG: class I SAM-dependent methyltransferase [Anaerolineales bacterium]|nr:class I SAM-dependent methyltransferase [Anaerolineales bacterium]
MNILKRLFFNLRYFSNPPWDTGISPPELLEFIAAHPAGKAIDLGCGTGTNLITLAKHGWQVVGVDFAPRAVRKAKKKLSRLDIQATLLVEDVTRLESIHETFDLVLDIGCSHSLHKDQWDRYLARLDRLLEPGGRWLLYTFISAGAAQAAGITPGQVENISKYFHLISRVDGTERGLHPSAWCLYQKPNL